VIHYDTRSTKCKIFKIYLVSFIGFNKETFSNVKYPREQCNTLLRAVLPADSGLNGRVLMEAQCSLSDGNPIYYTVCIFYRVHQHDIYFAYVDSVRLHIS
jgi:hypothetical protein